MRYVCSAAVVALSVLCSPAMFAQNSFSLSYQFVSEVPSTSTLWAVTYSATVVNTGPALGSVTATLTGTTEPSTVRVNPNAVTLTFGPVAANGSAPSTANCSQGSCSATFTVWVNRTATPPFAFSMLVWSFTSTPAVPIANAGPNQTVGVGSRVILNGSGSTNPSEIGTLTYSWTFTSRPPGTSAVLFNATTVSPWFVADVTGEYVISLTVSNGTQTSAPSTVQITTINSPPVANAGPNQTVNLGSTVQLNGSGSTDVDGDSLTYSWTFVSLPSGSAATLTNPTSVNPTFVADVYGTYIVQLTVNDGHGNSSSADVTITTNITPPVANAGTNQTVAVRSVVQLNGSGSTDVDGFSLSYSWSLTTVPTGSQAAISNPNIVNPTFTADLPGTYVAQLIVNDGHNNSSTATVTITTTAILAPTANAGQNQTITTAGTTVQLSGSGTDPQNLPLTYSWSLTTKPTGSAAVLSGTTIPNPTFEADLPGTYVAQLIVNNGYLNSTPSTVMISNGIISPTANAGSNQSVFVNGTANLSGSASTDPYHDTLTYSWTFTSRPTGSNAGLVNPTTVSPSFVADVAGAYVIQLIVSDPYSSSTPVTVMVTASSEPTITLTPNPLSVPSNTTGTLTLTLSSQAGTNGQVISLQTSSTTIATVPPTVTVASGATTATITVTPVGAGSATITASAAGFSVANATVNVFTPAIALTLPTAVGLTSTTTGTITLNAPAPSAGLTVTLSQSGAGQVTIPNSVSIANGLTTATFNVTGVELGSVTISASATGYTGTSASINVNNLGQISLPSGVTLGPNQSPTFAVTLATAAPSGGVTITLSSNNTGVATISPTTVTIAPGATAPTTQPTITGVNFGTATISASAPGFIGASQSVTVSAALSFSPTSLTMATNATQNLTLNLSPGSAPAGGLTINLSSNNTSAATVPSTVTIPANASSVSVPVTAGVTSGSATIQAGDLPSLTNTTASVTVQLLGQISLPSSLTVGAGQATALNVTLSTAAPGGGVTVTLSSSDTTKATISPSTVTIAAGQTTPSTQPQVTGIALSNPTVTISATANGYTSASTKVTVTAGSAASITASAASSNQSAKVNTPFTNQLTVTVEDQFGNPVPNISVTFSAPTGNVASATFSPAGPWTTNSSGQVVVTATANTVAGSYNVTASAASVSTPALIALTNTAGNPTTIAATSGSPQSVAVGGAFANLVATVTDTYGNPVSGVQVTFAAPAGSVPSATLNPSTPQTTNSSGQVTVSATANSFAGAQYNVTATAAGVSTAANFALTNTPGSAHTVAASGGATQNTTINTAFANPLQVTVTDANNNPISGATVTFTVNPVSGAGATLTTPAATNSSGITSVTATANGTAGAYTVTATISGASTATFNLTNNGPNTMTVNGGNNQTVAVGAQFAAISVLVQDVNSKPVPNVVVTFTGPSGSGVAGIQATVTGTTNSSGIASATPTANTKAGAYTVNATVPGISAPTAFSLTNSAGTAANVAVVSTTNNQSATAGSAFSTALQVTVTDSNNNPVPNASVTFTPNAGTSGASGSFATSNTVTANSNGVATANALTANTKAGAWTVTATSGSGSATFSLTNNPGAPATLTPSTGSNNQSVQPNAAFSALSVTVTDANSNPISGVTVTFTVNAGSGGSSASFGTGNTTTATTNSSGVATTTSTLTANATVGAFTVVATPNSGSGSATFNLAISSGTPATLTPVASTNNQSVAIGTPFTALQVTVTDAHSNPVPNVSVTFTATAGSSGANGAFGTSSTNTVTTNSSGVATTSVALTPNTKAGAFTVVATPGTGTGSATFNLTNLPGAPATLTASSTNNNESAAINGTFSPALQVTVTDANSNPVSGVTVTFAATAGSSGANGTFTTNTGTTNSSGIATAGTLTANTKAGTFTVTATPGTGSGSATFNLTITPGPAAAIAAVSGSTPQSTSYGAAFSSPLAVTVTDASGNLVPNVTVNFAVTPSSGGASASLSAASGTTNSSGQTSVTATANSIAGSYTVTASVSGVTQTASFALTNTAPQVTGIAVSSGSGQQAQIDTAFALPLKALVTGTGGTPLAGVTVTFTINTASNGASATFPEGTVEQVVTNSSGIATSPIVTANSTASVGAYTVTASVSGLSTNFSLSNTAVAAGTILVTPASVGQSLQAEIAITIPENCPITSSSGCQLTVTSSNPSLVLVSARATVAGSTTTTTAIGETGTSAAIYVQGVGSSGSATITVSDASGLGFGSGSATVTLTPSAFVINAPNQNIGVPSFTTYSGVSSTFTVTPAQLDPSTLTYINSPNAQTVSAAACSVSCPVVTVSSSTTGVGTVTTGASLTFSAAGGAQNATFVASSVNTGTTTVTASVPTGFTTPGSAENTLNVTVQPGGIVPPTLNTVGYGLQVSATATFNGALAPFNSLTITSNNPNALLFSTSPTSAGSASISLTNLGSTGVSQSGIFYVQALVNSGSATYTLSAPGLGSATGTVNFGPSGFVVEGPDGIGAGLFTSPALGNTALTINPVLVDSNGNVLDTTQQLSPAQTVNVTVNSSNTTAGAASPATVSFSGPLPGNTSFVPGNSAGTTVLSVTYPTAAPGSNTGFSVVNAYNGNPVTISAQVTLPGISVPTGVSIGQNLEYTAEMIIGQVAPAGGTTVTVTSNDPNLLISSSPTTVGSATAQIVVPPGTNSAYYYLQALGTATPGNTATFSVSSPGFNSRTGTITYAYSGLVLSTSDFQAGDGSFAIVSLSENPSGVVALYVSTAPLLDANGDYNTSTYPIEALSPTYSGGTLTIPLNNAIPHAGTVPSSVTISPGTASAGVTFTPVTANTETLISIGAGSGFTVANSPANEVVVHVTP